MDRSVVKMDFSISAWRCRRLSVGAEAPRTPNSCLPLDMPPALRTLCCE
jgi:hypothetical protein